MNWLARFLRREPNRHDDLAAIRSEGLFDELWYLETYQDVREAKIDAAHHYLIQGFKEGRDPGPLFSTNEYLRLYPDVARSGKNPLIHFIRHGKQESRIVTPVGVAPAAVTDTPVQTQTVSLDRDNRGREFTIVKESGLFDEAWYSNTYADVAASGASPLTHYMLHGGFEGRDPGPLFSTLSYLREYPEVANEGINPLLHYLTIGKARGYIAYPTKIGGMVNAERDRRVNKMLAAREPAAVKASERSLELFRDALPNPLDHDGASRVPKIFHFVFGFHSSGELPYFGYLAIRSALHFNPGWTAYLYAMHEPVGMYWEKLKDVVKLVKVANFEYFMNSRFHHYAHKADVIRLIALYKTGGVYLDIDTITQRSFEDLRDHEFCMGVQSVGPDSIPGLCNAVMIGKPGARFSEKWLSHYDYFRSLGTDDLWDYHSVKLPGHLMIENPELITVLNYRAFFYPLWHSIEKIMFTDAGARYKSSFENAYCFHLWNGATKKTLNALDEAFIRTSKSLYAQIAKKVEGIE